MKIFGKTMPLLAAALLLGACDKEAGRIAEPDPAPAGKVRMTFGLAASDLRAPLQTLASTAESTEWESALKNLWVLQFNGQDAQSELVLAEYYDADKIVDNSVSVALFEVPVTRIYFVANVGAEKFKSLALKTKLDAFEASRLDFATETAVSADQSLPMVGVYDGDPTAATAEVKLTRMVAKIVFTCSVNVMAPTESFHINRIQLVNVSSGSLYKAPVVPAAQTNLWPDSSNSDNFFSYDEVAADVSQGQQITHTWYLPENLRGVVANLTDKTKGGANAPAMSTCIEVSGDYTQGNGLYDVTYRIYPGQNSSTDFNMIRNNTYTISSTIKGFNQHDLRVVVEKGIAAGKYTDGEW